ncbi:MAG: dienelactone hydrolase family protein [Bdellovibrionales bacterium]
MRIFIGALILLLSNGGIAGSKIEYKYKNAAYEGYFQKANGNSKGLVVVIHDWDGLTEYEEKRVQMLSELGFDAFAVDLYGKGNRPVETKMKKAETEKLYEDRQKMRELILAGLGQAKKISKHRPFVMGYCFGGAAVLELSRSGAAPSVKGYATFHGGLKTPEGQKFTKSAPIFIAHGGADTGIPMDDVSQLSKELEAANIKYEIEVYSGAPHAFTVFDSDRYRKRADEKSWSSFLNFLNTYQ